MIIMLDNLKNNRNSVVWWCGDDDNTNNTNKLTLMIKFKLHLIMTRFKHH